MSELGKLMNIYQAAGDKGKVMGYRRAISNIKTYSKPITDAKQMDEIPYVGDGIKKKVKAEQYGEHFGSLQIKYVDIPIKVYNIGQTMPKT